MDKFRLPRKLKKLYKNWHMTDVVMGTFFKYYWNQKEWNRAKKGMIKSNWI